MAVANLANAPFTVDTSKDSIVIVDNFQSIRGGRTLDVTGFVPTVINAGHVIIKETATNEYKPNPVAGTAFAALPAGHTYAGIQINSVLTNKAMVGILVRGTVNPSYPNAMPYDAATILVALKAALPLVDFRAD